MSQRILAPANGAASATTPVALPLAGKVRSAIVRVACIALLAVTAVFAVDRYRDVLAEREGYALAIARLLAENSEAALAFDDPEGVRDALAPLRKETSVLAAQVYRAGGVTIGSYRAAAESLDLQPVGSVLATEPSVQASLHYVDVAVPVRNASALVGHVHLRVSMAPAHASMQQFAAVAAVALTMVVLLTLRIARGLASAIVEPMRALATTMDAVAAEGSYSRRAVKVSDDEVGTLVDRFNELLHQIEDRDTALLVRQNELEVEVLARTNELLERNASLELAMQDVEQARARAQRASQAKSQFLANMSHEIRSPLNGVIGMAELLRSTSLDDRQSHFVGTILASSGALLAVLNDVLDLSKIEAGGMQIEEVEFDLENTIEESLQLFAEAAARKGVELVGDCRGLSTSTARGDPLRLRQVLVNLLSNAVKFTERGEIVLIASDTGSATDRREITFEVRDTGIGMDADVQSRVFEAFVQADGSTSRRFGGTGLGLAISQRIVALLGGELHVHSAPECGSTFTFAIPFGDGIAAPSDDQEIPGDPRRILTNLLRGQRISLVSSQPTTTRVLVESLQHWGANVNVLPSLAAATASLDGSSRAAIDTSGVAAWIIDFDHCGEDTNPRRVDGLHRFAGYQASRVVVLASVASLGWLGTTGPQTLHLVAKPLRRRDFCAALANALRAPDIDTPRLERRGISAATIAAHVLLVEDNPVNQEVAREHLLGLGCSVDVASDGEEALQRYSTGTFDLVLMDCQMPVLDGFAATRAIREMEQRGGASARRIPIIALTANAMVEDRDRCLAAGMDDFLSKPFRIDDLRAAVQRWAEPHAAVAAEYARQPIRPLHAPAHVAPR